MKPGTPLRSRVLAAVTGLSFVTCLVLSFYTVAFTYAVEDAFLAARLAAEGRYQSEARTLDGAWAPPRDDQVSLHEDMATLPAPVLALLREEPERVEFAAPGPSHYHLLRIEAQGDRAWLVYDAGKDLIVPGIRNRLLWLLGITTLILVGCALLVGHLLSRRVTRRLEQLATTVAGLDPEHLSANWSAAAGKDEVGIVAAGLDTMTGRLRAFIERERSFTRDASHELRTPLAVIRAAGDQLVQQPELGARSREHANLIRESTERLEQTVTTLLALAREESGGGAEEVQLLPLIEQVVIDQAPRLEGKRVEVVVDIPATARLPASAAVGRILLANLIGNAFAHTQSGLVRIDARAGRLRITNPVSPQAAEQAGAVPEAAFPGADGFGFGLGIVRRLCGPLGIDFELQLEGDTVIATLPLINR